VYEPITADIPGMSVRSVIAVLAAAAALAAPAASSASYSVGSSGQIAWVRRAATNFVTAELARNSSGACAILNTPLRTAQRHRTCEQRWNARLSRLLREPGARARLRTELHAIAHASVVVHGDQATIGLPAPLMGGPNRFLWTENCWMLEG
jgi:hypothetical protein